MTIIEYFLVVLLVVPVVFLVWWFDLFCLKRSEKQWVSKGACERFCSKRQTGCTISPEDAEARCLEKQSHEEAKGKFRSLRTYLKDKTGGTSD